MTRFDTPEERQSYISELVTGRANATPAVAALIDAELAKLDGVETKRDTATEKKSAAFAAKARAVV